MVKDLASEAAGTQTRDLAIHQVHILASNIVYKVKDFYEQIAAKRLAHHFPF